MIWTMSDKITCRGVQLLGDPVLNKGTAFTLAERDAFGLHGLLPPHVQTQAQQVDRVLENLARKSSDLERYIAIRFILACISAVYAIPSTTRSSTNL